ncbi:hypothetical protein RHSP_66376 [Rhizobium freirei PRF 81]|uniref:Uncharacterized protein n=1 Tax=Rhizobium freirei PRF 81 TaxID=363754 RepID=N6VEA2_9HYPH|nr:hypothetical protein RHSP_66376 [Rhizobium freirei PRF 81]
MGLSGFVLADPSAEVKCYRAALQRRVSKGLDPLDDDHFSVRHLLTDFGGDLVFRRVVAIDGVLQRRKLDHHVAAACLSLKRRERTAAGKEIRAVLFEGRLGGGDIVLVALDVADIHARDPISLCHIFLPACFGISERGVHLGEDGAGGLLRIGCLDDRPGDDQMARSGLDGGGRGHHPLLVALVAAGRTDAGGDQRHIGSNDLADRGRLFRRTDDTAHAGEMRLFGTAQHQRMRIIFIAGGDQVFLVHRCQNGDAEQAQVRPLGGLDGRLHRFRIGVQRQHRHAHLDDVLHPGGHRVVDVEQLHVEEDLLAVGGKVACKLKAAGKGELIADLVVEDIVAERADHFFGLLKVWNIQSNDQAVACGHLKPIPSSLPWVSSRTRSCASQDRNRKDCRRLAAGRLAARSAFPRDGISTVCRHRHGRRRRSAPADHVGQERPRHWRRSLSARRSHVPSL